MVLEVAGSSPVIHPSPERMAEDPQTLVFPAFAGFFVRFTGCSSVPSQSASMCNEMQTVAANSGKTGGKADSVQMCASSVPVATWRFSWLSGLDGIGMASIAAVMRAARCA